MYSPYQWGYFINFFMDTEGSSSKRREGAHQKERSAYGASHHGHH